MLVDLQKFRLRCEVFLFVIEVPQAGQFQVSELSKSALKPCALSVLHGGRFSVVVRIIKRPI